MQTTPAADSSAKQNKMVWSKNNSIFTMQSNAPSLETFKAISDGALGNQIYWLATLPTFFFGH